jgi:putative membrane protein insertion efficiency factor
MSFYKSDARALVRIKLKNGGVNQRNEKTYYNALEQCRQALAGISRKNGNERRQKNAESPSGKRQKNALHALIINILVAAITAYQQCSRFFLPRCCRYWPSCSEYSKQALLKYGVVKGTCKAAGRVLRCHPYSGRSGFDPLL